MDAQKLEEHREFMAMLEIEEAKHLIPCAPAFIYLRNGHGATDAAIARFFMISVERMEMAIKLFLQEARGEVQTLNS